MYYPFKERQYSLLSSFSLEENLPILKCECRVPRRSRSVRPGAAPALLLWCFTAPVDGHGMLKMLLSRAGCGWPGPRSLRRCLGRSGASRAAFPGVRQQGWKYKLGNQVKPLHGCRSPAHTLLSCSLECATWEKL